MIWIASPLIVLIFAMEFYFGRYSKEELGWNAAITNCILLIFISIDLLRYLYSDISGIDNIINDFTGPLYAKTSIAITVFIIGIWLLYIDYFHVLSKEVSFTLSSDLFLNLFAYFSIVAIYSDILTPNDAFNYVVTALSIMILFIILIISFASVRAIIRMLIGEPVKSSKTKKNSEWLQKLKARVDSLSIDISELNEKVSGSEPGTTKEKEKIILEYCGLVIDYFKEKRLKEGYDFDNYEFDSEFIYNMDKTVSTICRMEENGQKNRPFIEQCYRYIIGVVKNKYPEAVDSTSFK